MRESSQPAFWEVRYEREEHLFGTAPNTFVATVADRVPPGADVVELGAGEGRNLIFLAETRDCSGTAVDFAPTALQHAEQLATTRTVALEVIQADVRTWGPARRWEVALVTFLQLLPGERPRLYRLLQQIVRPGGWVFAEWFRPDHLTGDFARIGPSAADRMVPAAEVRSAFANWSIERCAPADVMLQEGPRLRGAAAVLRFAAQAPHPTDEADR
ncbi:MAG: methyltransferase domain-containing protein [Bacteroidetes bacterium]|jgi:SAM-dependent methyltransferase|nr:methyltransferase domain-containing protein [Bacteroidota bacterium]